MPAGRQEGGNPETLNVLKRMDSRLKISGMTAMKKDLFRMKALHPGFFM